MIAPIVSLVIAFTAALNLASTASATTAAVRIVPAFPLERYARAGAVGLVVPASGEYVTRANALAALRTGKTRPSKLGGMPEGPDQLGAALGRGSADVTIYVSLPPPGRHRNDRRYPIAIVGDGYHGLLTSSRTKIGGLISIADVAPTVEALECRHGPGRCGTPTIRSRADDDAPGTLRSLDRRFDRLVASRLWARIVVFTAMLTLAAAALWLRSVRLARAAILAPALALAASLVLSALGESRALVTAPVLGLAAVAAIPASRLPLGWFCAVLLAAFTLVFVAWPEVPPLAALGPHAEGGGRFYGLTNTTETILLAPALVAGAALGPLWIGLLAAGTTVAGVDGGGLIVVFAAFIVLALLLGRARQAAALASIAGIGVLLVAAGVSHDLGSNHVTDAASSGAGGIVHALTRRWHLSWERVTASPLALVLFLGCLAALVALARSRPRSAILDALLVAIVVSLVFNDSPNDVIRFGAAAAATVWAWQRLSRQTPKTER